MGQAPRRRTEKIEVYVTEDEKDKIEEIADNLDRKLSNYGRRQMLKPARKEEAEVEAV